MTMRLLRAYVPSLDHELELQLRTQAGVRLLDIDERPDRDHVVVEIVVPTGRAEAIVKALHDRYGARDDFRILITPLASMVPALEADADEDEDDDDDESVAPTNLEELHAEVQRQCNVNWPFAASLIIATTVAATGIVRDSTELIVASMVIAPLLGPNVALATATALGDLKLGRRALSANAVGFGLTFVTGVVMGFIFDVPMSADHVARRLLIGPLDIVVAATAGAAGALAYTSGAFGTVVGVMIAVALLPPLVLCGMFVGSGEFTDALGPGLLTLANFIGINLAGVVVLFLRNVRPRRFHEQADAKRAVATAIIAWGFLLALLTAVIVVFPEYRTFP